MSIGDIAGGASGRRHSSGTCGPLLQAIGIAAVLLFGHPAAQAQSLAAPTVLSATAYSAGQINLVWTDPNPALSGTGETGYIVQRAQGTSGWDKVFMSDPGVTSWSDTCLSAGTTYNYRVKAYAFVGDQVIYSAYSPVVSATTPSGGCPDPPTNLTASALSGTQIKLAWQDNSNNETGYTVSRSLTSSGLWTLVATIGNSQLTYTDSGLTPGTSYSYKVRAYNSTGKSAPSNVATVVTNNAASGAPVLWSKRFGGSGGDGGIAVDVDPFGNLLVAGVVSGAVDLGGGPLAGVGTSAFIAKYSPSRTYLWAKRFDGSGGSSTAYAVAADGNGNVFITGSFMGTVNFGGGPLTSAGWPMVPNQDVFIAAYSPTGAFRWAVGFGGGLHDIGSGIATTANGDVIVTGQIGGRVNLGCGSVSSAFSSHDMFLARYSGASGACQWAKLVGGSAEDAGAGVAVASNGDIVAAGYFQGTADFGGGPVTSAGLSDIFVARYSGQGAYLWVRRVGSTGDDRANAVALDANGNVAVTGYFSGTVDFGGGPLTSLGSWDAFVAKCSATGAYLWARDLRGTATDEAFGVATDANGNVVVTGGFQGTVNFGGGPLTSAGFWDAFVAKYSAATGGHLWSKAFGSSNDDLANAVAVDGNGNAIVTGYFQTTVDFDGPEGPLTSAGLTDIFLLSVSP